ncbi:CRISPR-associated protein Csx16 [Paraferrimonas haliotis]|uniref:CRISPR-associated protein Csx16 n=1 Tax=Paraferrimonas haliotis TaxID=2013866 RepID=UPI000BA92744|nr:CRISPR-associated protein Csx16 [Paraferrimonas haliotis]
MKRKVIVSRHPAAVRWLEQLGFGNCEHQDHLSDINTLKEGDLVIGTLPIHLIAALTRKRVTYWHLSLTVPAHLRGVEMSENQLLSCSPRLERFDVVQMGFLEVI